MALYYNVYASLICSWITYNKVWYSLFNFKINYLKMDALNHMQNYAITLHTWLKSCKNIYG